MTAHPKPRKRSKRPSMKEADRLFSRFIRLRDGSCRACGTPENLQCAHIITRAYKVIRHDPENAVALCQGCHVKYTHRPLEWRLWVDETFGLERWENLQKQALTYTKVDYKAVCGWLRARLKEMEA